jgi:thiol-disulfide isomerase/thioredoxin/tetratricopeptide (TPR) repeat protein
MRSSLIRCIVTLATLGCAAAQQPPTTKGSVAAKAEFDKGAAALRENDWDGAVTHYGKAVELDLDFFEAHEQYVFVCTAGPKNYNNDQLHAELETQYKKWAAEHAEKAVFPYSLGHILMYNRPDEAVEYLKQAVKIDPKFAPAWDLLGTTAEAQGKLDDERAYERRAAEAWPENVRYARHAAGAWMMADFPAFRKASMELIEHHPDEAANWLQYLAMRALRLEDSRAVLELIHDEYLQRGASYLEPLFHFYIREDPAKALKLAGEVLAITPKNTQWQQLVDYAKAVLDARAAIAAANPSGAVDFLKNVKQLPPRADRRMLDVTRAQAEEAAGNAEGAYNRLLEAFAAKPNDEARPVLFSLGRKLGKDTVQVDRDVYGRRAATAKPGIPFSSTTYPDNRPLKLSDYAGKVFLLNFWYPLCGPCRGEFPSLQAVLDKYKDRGFQIVAINVHPKEDNWVMSLIQGWKLGFLPVHGDEDVMKAYNVRGAPSNFLYGPDGRIYYTPGPVNTVDARRELELQIEGLLTQVQ